MSLEKSHNWPEFLRSEKERSDRDVVFRLERTSFKRRIKTALESGAPFVAEHAALREPDSKSEETEAAAPLTEEHVEQAIALLKTMFPMTEKNLGLYDHLLTSSTLARRIAEELKRQGEKIDPIQIQIRALFDDLGRLMGQQRYLRNDLEGHALGTRLGLRKNFFDHRGPHDIVNPDAFTFEELSIEDRVVIIADVVGKRDAQGKVRTFDQALDMHYKSRHNAAAYKERIGGTDPAFPSELGGLRAMEEDKNKFGHLYEQIDHWLLKREPRIDIDMLAEGI